MVILPPEQGYGHETNLKQGEDDVNSSLETLPNDVAGWVEVCRDSPGKEYVASEASNSVGPKLERKNNNPPQRIQTENVAQT